jgi:hypothetical protein
MFSWMRHCFAQRARGAPASRVLVRENEAGEVIIHYRGQRLGFRELKAASTALGEGRDSAPSRAPIPEPYAISSSPTDSPSSLATRLAANENTGFFLGLVKPQPGDISIVDKPGTLLMCYDKAAFSSVRSKLRCPLFVAHDLSGF